MTEPTEKNPDILGPGTTSPQPLPPPMSLPPEEQLRGWRNVKAVCELFDLAFLIKSTALRRLHPTQSDQWIQEETLKSIERGCK